MPGSLNVCDGLYHVIATCGGNSPPVLTSPVITCRGDSFDLPPHRYFVVPDPALQHSAFKKYLGPDKGHSRFDILEVKELAAALIGTGEVPVRVDVAEQFHVVPSWHIGGPSLSLIAACVLHCNGACRAWPIPDVIQSWSDPSITLLGIHNWLPMQPDHIAMMVHDAASVSQFATHVAPTTAQ